MKILFTIGMALVLICAILGSMGYRGREQVVGIDLGTTFSVVAIKFSNGTVKIIPDYKSKELLTPSVVHYFKNGTALAGSSAIPYRESHPLDTIYNSKRFIGKLYDDVQREKLDHRFPVANTTNGTSEFSLHACKKSVSPQDVATEVLRHLYKSIEVFVGYPIKTAIICIPAKFGSAEAESTKLAFEMAGFTVQRVMDEPTAAAVAYNLHKAVEPKHILVYDLGGGTLDASLLWMNGNAVTVVGTAGDDHLGGSDFDHVVQNFLAMELPNCASSQLGLLAEKAKIELSSTSSTVVTCNGEETIVTREKFEEETEHLFERALLPIEKILSEAMMETKHVDDIVLVGGATRMPRLQKLIRDYFPLSTPIHMDIDPDTTVAHGAANIW